MKKIPFIKIQATGNDFVIIDNIKKIISSPKQLAKKICASKFGIGADGLILVEPSKCADFKMRIFNADGSEAEMCGNGMRSFCYFLHKENLTKKKEIKVETKGGIILNYLKIKNGKIKEVKVNIGKPRLKKEELPYVGKQDNLVNIPLTVSDKKFFATLVSMGNPHCVIFFNKDIDKIDISKYGYLIENLKLFPQRTNVEFVQVLSHNKIKLRVWERGVGETLSCGTGACASVVAGVLVEKINKKATVYLKGGKLSVMWDEDVFLSGDAEIVFEGKYYRNF
jgi:diaminopimelate epimerase